MDSRSVNSSGNSVSRILFLGGGFGGAYGAQAFLKAIRSRKAETVLIDQRNYFVFYPLCVKAGTGSLEPRHAVVSIRKFISKGDFRMTDITGVYMKLQELSLPVNSTASSTTQRRAIPMPNSGTAALLC